MCVEKERGLEQALFPGLPAPLYWKHKSPQTLGPVASAWDMDRGHEEKEKKKQWRRKRNSRPLVSQRATPVLYCVLPSV
ncbi:unnamed protein product [Arctogadus glacialis]